MISTVLQKKQQAFSRVVLFNQGYVQDHYFLYFVLYPSFSAGLY